MTLDGTSGITQMTGSIVMSGSTSGTTTIIPSAVAGSNTATLPAATGTVMVSGNMPAFSAYASSGTSCANTTYTKIAFQVENFDTNSNYDNATNYRFTPTVAGYYQINAAVAIVTALGYSSVSLYKNGSLYNTGGQIPNNSVGVQVLVSSLIYMNGTTDYLEIYFYQTSGGTVSTYSANNNQYSYFNGFLARAA